MNPELQRDENADWMTQILKSTLRALISWESDRAVKWSEIQNKQKRMNAIIKYPCESETLYINAYYDDSLLVSLCHFLLYCK